MQYRNRLTINLRQIRMQGGRGGGQLGQQGVELVVTGFQRDQLVASPQRLVHIICS
jgi:hypothetical protein